MMVNGTAEPANISLCLHIYPEETHRNTTKINIAKGGSRENKECHHDVAKALESRRTPAGGT